jgi:hypothetical protein
MGEGRGSEREEREGRRKGRRWWKEREGREKERREG